MNLRVIAPLVVLLCALSGIAAPPQLVVPGRWEITLRNELPHPSAPVSFFVCIEPGPAERPEPPKSKPSDPCQITGGGVAGNVVTFSSNCGASKKSNVRIEYGGDHYEGVVDLEESTREVRQIITARRVGSCEDPVPVQVP